MRLLITIAAALALTALWLDSRAAVPCDAQAGQMLAAEKPTPASASDIDLPKSYSPHGLAPALEKLRAAIVENERRIAALERAEPDPEPEPEPTPQAFSPANLKLVGGYRVPSYNANPYARGTSTFTAGGMACHTFPDGRFVCWHDSTAVREVMQSSTDKPMGKGADYVAWPLLNEAASAAEVWTKGELFGDRGGNSYQTPEGIAYDAEADRLYVSMRSDYNTAGDAKQWLAVVDASTGEVLPIQPDLSGVSQSRYGGGMTWIPQAWADKHTGGKRLAFASGGYRSGQGSSHGPTFAAVDPATFAVQELLYHPPTHLAVSQKGKVARAFPDYGPRVVSWVNPPEGGVGYWPGAAIKGNGAWVDFGGLEGVLWFSRHPMGDLDYSLQNETFSNRNQNVAYFLPAERLAEVAAGEREPDSLAEAYTFCRWDSESNGGLPLRPASCCFDSGSGLLWVFYVKAWSSGVEKHPIAAAYEIVEAGA